jgi:hypothetical protein
VRHRNLRWCKPPGDSARIAALSIACCFDPRLPEVHRWIISWHCWARAQCGIARTQNAVIRNTSGFTK